MPAQLTTRAQVNGYRFLLKRLEHAMVRRDVRMLHDPMRSQLRSLAIGLVVGILVVAGCAILAFLKPQGSVGDAHIIMGKDSGALYAVVENKLHPVLNLASARLITGSAESPTSVKESKLASLPRGPLLGIPGAPAALPGSRDDSRSDWTLCESDRAAGSSGVTTTVLAGRPALGRDTRRLSPDEALLVSNGGKTYLLYDGKRAELDMNNSAVTRSLKLQGRKPRPVGTGLLDATIEVPALTPPTIEHAGEPAKAKLAALRVGSVVKVADIDSSELYVVLADGVQRISPLAAQVIRNANSQGMNNISAVPPDALDGLPVVDVLPVNDFPVDPPKILTAEDAPVACMTWSRTDGARSADLSLVAGHRLPLSSGASPVQLATADGSGDRVDAVYVPPSSGEFVQVTGLDATSSRRETLFYVADNGIRYGVPDKATAQILGLGDSPKLAPWPIISALVPGPTLAKSHALVSHDSLPEPRRAG